MARQKASLLHVQLKLKADGETVEFRYFGDNPNQYEPEIRQLGEIAALAKLAERDYFVPLPEDYATTGKTLFGWLDGPNRVLQTQLDQQLKRGQVLVLAIAAEPRLAHLPWEILHNQRGFLVGQDCVPVRWAGRESKLALEEREVPRRSLQLLFMATSPDNASPKLDFEAEEAAILQATRRKPIWRRVERTPPILRSALYSPLLLPFGSGVSQDSTLYH